jgi:hypothetical protein
MLANVSSYGRCDGALVFHSCCSVFYGRYVKSDTKRVSIHHQNRGRAVLIIRSCQSNESFGANSLTSRVPSDLRLMRATTERKATIDHEHNNPSEVHLVTATTSMA